MSRQAGVVAVTSLAFEAYTARGPVGSVLCHQVELSAVLGGEVERGASGIISFGIAGELAPGLVTGDWVVASRVRNGKDAVATDRAWAQRLLKCFHTTLTQISSVWTP
jgi:hypothetical protein